MYYINTKYIYFILYLIVQMSFQYKFNFSTIFKKKKNYIQSGCIYIYILNNYKINNNVF